MKPEVIEPTLWQQRVLTLPLEHDLALLGGRGLGKSWCLAFLALQTAERLRDGARMLFLRKTLKGTEDFALCCRKLFSAAYGKGASFNQQQGRWTLPNGASLSIHELSDYRSLDRFTGQSYSLVMLDQAEQHSSPELLDMLRGSLRGAEARLVIVGHAGGPGDHWLRSRYVQPSEAWKPFKDPISGRSFIRASGTFKDNPTLSRDYESQIKAATAGDEDLQRAWLEGSFAVSRGAYFSGTLDPDRCACSWPTPQQEPDAWRRMLVGTWQLGGVEVRPTRNTRPSIPRWPIWLSLDWGSRSPSVCYFITESPGTVGPDGYEYPRGSLIAFDEVSTHEPNDLTRGDGATVPQLGERILERMQFWGLYENTRVFCDPSMKSKTRGRDADALFDELRKAGLHPEKANNDRLWGWQRMRTMFLNCGEPGSPGLYVDRRCQYFWETVPTLPRSRKDPEDVEKCSTDHGADSLRYALSGRGPYIPHLDGHFTLVGGGPAMGYPVFG